MYNNNKAIVDNIEVALDLAASANIAAIKTTERISSEFSKRLKFVAGTVRKIGKDLNDDNEQFDCFEKQYFEAISRAEVLKNELGALSESSSAPRAQSVHSNSNSNSFIRLPTINLPKFHGEIDNWMEFRETFSNLIHENHEITNIRKLHYLKASLFGEAAEVIKCLEFTSSNYIIAFNSICERYNNPQMLVHNHVKSILDLETSTKESAFKLRKINHSLLKHVSALKSLATEAELLDAILIHIVSNKLDYNISGPICALCKQPHYLSKCDRFHKLARNEPSVEQVPALSHAEIPDRSRIISAFSSNTTQVLLPTAIGQIMDSTGKLYEIRILLDFGSQSNFIKSSLCKKLKLPVQSINASISGLAQASSLVHSKCDVEIHADQSPFKLQLSCLVLDEITASFPGIRVDLKHFKIPDNIRLPDPSFGEPYDIDLLLGASTFFNILCIRQVSLGSNLPVLQKNRFGWVVSGSVGYQQDSRVQYHLSCTEELPDQLNKFWELKHYPSSKALSSEEKTCESHYLQNTKRNSYGRFAVSIPFKAPVELLGDSYKIAAKRFISLERRLQLNPRLYEQYSRFMKE
ncbi:hypothetical protein HUJ05_001803 [Dendroctonus ponderosae]|nr:hypothetical protein HUJ05_001803 [Dendroctonus ponderosae]